MFKIFWNSILVIPWRQLGFLVGSLLGASTCIPKTKILYNSDHVIPWSQYGLFLPRSLAGVPSKDLGLRVLLGTKFLKITATTLVKS